MWKFKINSNKVNWGFIEIDDSMQSLKMVIFPKAVPLRKEFLKSLQKKLLQYLESEGFEIIRNYPKEVK